MKLVKMLKFLMVLILLIIFILIVIIFNNSKKEKNNWLIKVDNVSYNCLSNSLYIYEDKSYIVIRAYRPNGIFNSWKIGTGKIKYDYNISEIIKEVNSISSDIINYINYKITFSDGTTKIISIKDSIKLNEFINQIPIKNIFLCN